MLKSLRSIPSKILAVLRYTKYGNLLISHANRFLKMRIEPATMGSIKRGKNNLVLDFANFEKQVLGNDSINFNTKSLGQKIIESHEEANYHYDRYVQLRDDINTISDTVDDLETLYNNTEFTLDSIAGAATPVVKIWDGISGSNTDIDLTVTTAQNLTSGVSSTGRPELAYLVMTQSPHDPTNSSDVIAQAGVYAVTGALPLFKTGWNGVTQFTWRLADWKFLITPVEGPSNVWSLNCTVVAPST